MVHLDFHPSNLMWRVVNSPVQVQVIDWDSACEKDQPMPVHFFVRLRTEAQSYRRDLLSSIDHMQVSTEWDLSLLNALKVSLDDATLQTTDKLQLDNAFQNLCSNYKMQEQMEQLSVGSD